MTIATYQFAPPTRPDIHHDNGFLDEYSPRPPATRDIAAFSSWVARLEAAEAIQGVPLAPKNDIPDALGAYRHFLFGDGADRTISYERFVHDDPSGQTVLANLILEFRGGTEDLMASVDTTNKRIMNAQITGTGIPIGAGDSTTFPYPATENWQKAIGAHSVWLSGDVEIRVRGDDLTFTAVMTVHAEDRYNFNPGQEDIATGIPDSDNGIFEITGLGHQYMNYGELVRTVRWNSSDPALTRSSASSNRRQRQPQNNRRVRNRL